MRRIAVFTATRAEYHLLSPVLRRINESKECILDLIVSGTHLSEKYGNTIGAIKKDGIPISKEIAVLDEYGMGNVNEIIAKVLVECGQYFKETRPDMLVVLGDRYEIMGVVLAAANALIPIAHIHGGETTEGAIDEAVRHSVTKFSQLHFACCEQYRHRIIQLGENPNLVYNCGALGVENILSQKLMLKDELAIELAFDLKKFCLVTFHPVTLEKETSVSQVVELYKALLTNSNYTYIITGANCDNGGNEINLFWERIAIENPDRFLFVPSLGMIRYLSAMKHCDMVIGNSSSGILETPTFEKPTINIGDRQKGRLRSRNIIDCEPSEKQITMAMKLASTDLFKESLIGMEQLYGDGHASEIIFNEIINNLDIGIDLKKSFYNISFGE